MKRRNRRLYRILTGLTGLQTLLLIISFTCGASLALLSVSQTLTNRFLTASPDIVIVEPNVDDPGEVDWGPNTKQVRISAGEEQGSVYVRVALVLSAHDSKGNLHPFNFGPFAAPDENGSLVAGDFTLHFNPNWEEDWFFKEGYFYYSRILNPGQFTSTLLEGVSYNGSTADKDKYHGLRIDVDVLADSIQAKGEAVIEWGVVLTADGRIWP